MKNSHIIRAPPRQSRVTGPARLWRQIRGESPGVNGIDVAEHFVLDPFTKQADVFEAMPSIAPRRTA
jgi:hypothetical protein